MRTTNTKPKAAEVKKALKKMFAVDDAVDFFTNAFYNMKENSGTFESKEANELGDALKVLRAYADVK
jgi:hypothetical protein